MGAFTDVFRSRRMAILLGLGFSAGLPLMLTGQTLGAWLKTEQFTNVEIAAFASVGLPYTLKILWAPLLDRFRLPWLGRRRGWIATFQLALVAAIAVMASLEPRVSPSSLFLLAVVVAFLSASQDIVIDAFNADTLAPAERAAGSAVYVLGYRMGMLVTGTLALILADHIPWQKIYWSMALIQGVCVIATLFATEPSMVGEPPRSFAEAVVRPIRELFKMRNARVAIAFVALYKFGDYYAQPLSIPFLRDLHFSFKEIATLQKVLGTCGGVVGGLLAGGLVARFGLRRMLLAFGILQASTNLLYTALATVGKSYMMFGSAILCDNLANSMGTAAFVAFMMGLTSKGSSATQYALLTSLSSVGLRVFAPIGAGATVDLYGWQTFFTETALFAIPGLLLIALLPIADRPPAETASEPPAER